MFDKETRTSMPCWFPSRSHACNRGAMGHEPRQACLLSKTPDADRLGGAGIGEGRCQVRRGHADGQPGILQPGRPRVLRNHLSGEIGSVTEVHAWTDRPGKYWPQNPDVVPKEAPVPATLDWEILAGRHDPAAV